MINEQLAKNAKQSYSFSNYVDGSTTKYWQEYVLEAKKYLEEHNIENQEEILNKYAKKTSDWINKENSITASCPSIMIAGGSNFPVHKKEKQNQRAMEHYKKHDYIFDIRNYIHNQNKKTEIKQDIESKEYQYKDLTIIQNTDDNRLQIKFDYKPSEEVRNILKSNGFKWSPKNETWQRQLTSNALRSFEYIKDKIIEKEV